MKKKYIKPDIVFESFSISTNIAGDCESIVGNPSKGTCGIPGSDGSSLFSTLVSGCDVKWDELEGDNYNGFCYHNPSDDNNLFNS